MRKYYSTAEAKDMIPLLQKRMINLIKLSKAIDLLDSIDIQYADEFETIKKDVQMNKKFHEYKALIIGYNPLAPLAGVLPFSFEYYLEERLGYELVASYVRNEFMRSGLVVVAVGYRVFPTFE